MEEPIIKDYFNSSGDYHGSEAGNFLWAMACRLEDTSSTSPVSLFSHLEDVTPEENRFSDESSVYVYMRDGYSSELEYAHAVNEAYKENHKGRDKEQIPFADFSFYKKNVVSETVFRAMIQDLDNKITPVIVAVYVVYEKNYKVKYWDEKHSMVSTDETENNCCLPHVHIIFCRTGVSGMTVKLKKEKLVNQFKNLIAYKGSDFYRPWSCSGDDHRYYKVSDIDAKDNFHGITLDCDVMEYVRLLTKREILNKEMKTMEDTYPSFLESFLKHKEYLNRLVEKSGLEYISILDGHHLYYDITGTGVKYLLYLKSKSIDELKLSAFSKECGADEVIITPDDSETYNSTDEDGNIEEKKSVFRIDLIYSLYGEHKRFEDKDYSSFLFSEDQRTIHKQRELSFEDENIQKSEVENVLSDTEEKAK